MIWRDKVPVECAVIKEPWEAFASQHHHVDELQHQAADLVLKDLNELSGTCMVELCMLTHILMLEKMLELCLLAVEGRLSNHALLFRYTDSASSQICRYQSLSDEKLTDVVELLVSFLVHWVDELQHHRAIHGHQVLGVLQALYRSLELFKICSN